MTTLSPEQCRAARGLLGWTQDDLGLHAGVSRSTVRDFETGRHHLHRATEAQMIDALHEAGVVLLEADATQPAAGPGVRLRLSREAPARETPAREPPDADSTES